MFNKLDFDIDILVKQITDEIIETLEKEQHKKDPFYIKKEWDNNTANIILNAGASRIGTYVGIKDIDINLAPYIDHTLLKPEATPEQIEKLCEEALKYNFTSVCVNPCYVKYAKELLKGSSVKVCTVIGFPLGATLTPVKVYEAQLSEYDGAEEVDMVIPIGALKSGAYDYVENDIASVVKNTSKNTIVKVIIETALLNDNEKIKACEIAKKAGADFVKTSTGFGPGGATVEDVALMRRVVGSKMGVKASGGIRTKEAAISMIKAGANRLGTSASVKIMKGE